MRFASSGQRFVNLLVDYAGVFAFATVVGVVFAFVSALLSGGVPPGTWIHQLVGGIAMIAYYVLFESLAGRTLGKLVTGTKVVSADGRPASFSQIVGRTFARFIPFDALTFFGSTPGWHDTLSKTRVIRVR
jgi:uncharacterized RDD family membrane protein YckC